MRTFVEFKGGDVQIRINANGSGAENWWNDLQEIAKEKLGDTFEG